MDESKEDLKNILTRYKRIAVVGLSSDPGRPSHGVTEYLIEQGYEIVGVNPAEKEILGRPCYPSIDQVPGPLEIVDVFRNPKAIPELVEQLIPLKPKVLWLQEGASNPDAEKRAKEAGITIVTDRCILKEHVRAGLRDR